MRRRMIVVVLLLCLPMVGEGQSIRYYPDAATVTLGNPQSASIRYYPKTGYDWYVDSVSGSDAADGKSESTALQTIAVLLGKSIAAGERIGLATGSHWREELVVPSDNVAVESYGSGVKPLLDASEIIAAGDWSKTGGLTNVYQATLTLAVADPATGYIRAWEDDTKLTLRASTALVDANAGSYAVSAHGTTPFTLYIHASDSSDPGTSGKVYEYNKRRWGLESTAQTGVIVRGIHTRRNYHPNGSLVVGDSSYVYDSVADEGTKHNAFGGANTTFDGVTATEAVYSSALSMIVFFKPDPAGASSTCRNCTADNTGGSTLSGGLYAHTAGGAAKWGTVYFIDSTATNAFMQAGDTNNFVCTNCIVTGDGGLSSGGGINAPAAGTTTVTGGSVTGRQYAVNAIGAGSTINVSGMTATGAGNSGAFFHSNQANTTASISDVTLANFRHGLWLNNATGMSLYARRVTITSVFTYYWYIQLAGPTLDLDYNAFPSAVGNKFLLDGTEYTLANWRIATGQDTHSTP